MEYEKICYRPATWASLSASVALAANGSFAREPAWALAGLGRAVEVGPAAPAPARVFAAGPRTLPAPHAESTAAGLDRRFFTYKGDWMMTTRRRHHHDTPTMTR